MGKGLEDDASVVDGCIKKDLAAWSVFTKRYSGLIHASIENRLKKYGFTLSREDVEDIHQNVLASIWNDAKLADVRDRDNISHWLAIVAGNSAIEYVRKNLTHKEARPLSLLDKIGEKEFCDLVPSVHPDPADESICNEVSKMIEESIDALPEKERLIMKLNLFHDKTHDQIACILDLPKGTVSSYVKRAKERLRKDLKDCI